MSNTNRLASIDFLLQDLPPFTCKEGCSDCCGPIIMTRLERKRICERTGMSERQLDIDVIIASGSNVCPLLKNGRCSVYDIRPAICRIFGVSQAPHLDCPHIKPPLGSLNTNETALLVDKIRDLGHGLTVPLK